MKNSIRIEKVIETLKEAARDCSCSKTVNANKGTIADLVSDLESFSEEFAAAILDMSPRCACCDTDGEMDTSKPCTCGE